MPEMVYKICTVEAWKLAISRGEFIGSSDDLRDGYIHLSTKSQVEGTLARHFRGSDGSGLTGLIVVSFDADRLGASLKWEPARSGSVYPHHYGPLDTHLAECVWPLAVEANGQHVIPGDL